MSPIATLRKASGKSITGGLPAFTEAHVLIALERIGSGEGIGRQQLARILRIGEGTTRTLVNRLRRLNLLETSRGGMRLTQEGLDVLAELRALIKGTVFPDTQITVGSENYAVIVKGASQKVRRGIEQRDAAIIIGAQGATTLVFDEGGLRMPGEEERLEPDIEGTFLDKLEPEVGDVIIIGSSDDSFLAELGAKAAALELLRE